MKFNVTMVNGRVAHSRDYKCYGSWVLPFIPNFLTSEEFVHWIRLNVIIPWQSSMVGDESLHSARDGLNRPNLSPWLIGYRVNAFTCTWEYINYSESVLRRTRITADSRVSSDFISSSPRVCCLWYQLWSCLALTHHIELHSRSVIVQISEEVIYRFADLLFAQIKLQKFLGRIVPFDEVALELPFYRLIPFGLFILEFKWLE